MLAATAVPPRLIQALALALKETVVLSHLRVEISVAAITLQIPNQPQPQLQAILQTRHNHLDTVATSYAWLRRPAQVVDKTAALAALVAGAEMAFVNKEQQFADKKQTATVQLTVETHVIQIIVAQSLSHQQLLASQLVAQAQR